jgi:hypothetical protein
MGLKYSGGINGMILRISGTGGDERYDLPDKRQKRGAPANEGYF